MIEIIIAVVAFYAGWKLREWAAIRVVNSHMNNYRNFLQDLKEEVDSRTINVVIEKNDGQFLVYNKETNEFLAQGENHDEIAAILKKRFPTMFFSADPNNMKEVGYEVPKVNNNERL